MSVGVYLMTRMTVSTGLPEAVIYMVVAGIGIGIFFSILTLAVQNALPRTRLGVGTGAVRYLSQLGSTLGVAIVGTVVNNTISSDIVNRLPDSAVKQLTPAGLKFATNPQVLVNSTYHDTVVKTAERFAVAQATSHIPPGPQHNQAAAAAAAQAIQQVQHLLNQVFEALKLSLAVAIQHGFVTILFFCIATIIAAFFLKDVPLAKEFREDPGETGATEGSEKDVSVAP
jgi:TRAP-type C4-dicarboxylate transport system permease small subunit